MATVADVAYVGFVLHGRGSYSIIICLRVDLLLIELTVGKASTDSSSLVQFICLAFLRYSQKNKQGSHLEKADFSLSSQ